MQLKSSVLPLLALISLATANAQRLGYGEDYSDSLDAVAQQELEADPIIFDTDITEQDAGFHRRHKGPIAIVPVKGANKCLDVRNANFQNGTPVQIYDCNGTTAQKWVINRYSGHVRVSGTNFCLDATRASPGNGVGLKIWTCIKNLPAQTWWYRGDGTIRMHSPNKCVDLSGGSLANGRQSQVWTCDGHQNQIWGLRL